MPDTTSELLRPSLTHVAPRLAPFSLRAQFLTAFLGGPVAAWAITAFNAHRLSRLPRNLPLLIVGGAAWVAYLFTWLTPTARAAAPWLEPLLASPGLSLRALALAIFGAAAWLQRREQAACDLMGTKRPNGTLLATLLILAGNALSLLIMRLYA